MVGFAVAFKFLFIYFVRCRGRERSSKARHWINPNIDCNSRQIRSLTFTLTKFSDLLNNFFPFFGWPLSGRHGKFFCVDGGDDVWKILNDFSCIAPWRVYRSGLFADDLPSTSWHCKYFAAANNSLLKSGRSVRFESSRLFIYFISWEKARVFMPAFSKPSVSCNRKNWQHWYLIRDN